MGIDAPSSGVLCFRENLRRRDCSQDWSLVDAELVFKDVKSWVSM